MTPLEGYQNFTSDQAKKDHAPWSEKTIDKLFWRGSTTGASYNARKGFDWRKTHRPALALMTGQTIGEKDVWVKKDGQWVKETFGMRELNERYMDVGLMGKAHQVSEAGVHLQIQG